MFSDLQQVRHEADYDTGQRFSRQETLDVVEQAVALLALSSMKG